ncbi:MAG TPA: Lon family ATP-dependent protease [Candidatus Dormibacteraeota bacterium]|nr:Lon family ATP-dependent protease [Candidatus Dormibacteraeota bacterium]
MSFLDDPNVRAFRRHHGGEADLRRQVDALFDVLTSVLGPDKLVLKAGKLGALKLLRSRQLPERLLALRKLVFEDPTVERVPARGEWPDELRAIEDELANLVAQRTVEDTIERKINEKMVERHQDYLRDLRLEALKEDAGPETPATQKKLEELLRLESTGLAASALQLLRPTELSQVVGQEAAITSLLAKIASPYPQHVILYGPPGVGKTTVARLVLETAKRAAFTPFKGDAPFVEVSGSTLRWDPRETTNPLLGSVHDPIYQGSRREFAEGGVPEPKLGLVTRAHGGVLFIDEIGELDATLQVRLLKVLEDKRVTFESSYYDPSDPNVPAYVKQLFEQGAPADFILVGATTRDPEEIDPAIRSRCTEVYFEPLSQGEVELIVAQAAGRLGVKLARGVATLVAAYTIEGRKAVQMLADAYGHALQRVGRRAALAKLRIEQDDVMKVVEAGRLSRHTPVRASESREIGKTIGLGVVRYIGSLIEIEATAFPAREARKGAVRFNETAGTMAKDSVFNAASVVRAVAGLDPTDYDLHVNVIGGGNIDGPSAGLAIFLALYSAIAKTPLPQDVAVTGEVSIQGRVRPVGGVNEKIYAARQAGMRAVLVPKENARELPAKLAGIEIVPIAHVREALAFLAPAKRVVTRAPRSRRAAPR